MCISSPDPPTLVAYVEVPGAESNSSLYAQELKPAESHTATFKELPRVPAYFAAN
jgi:hypothetical protein